MASYFCDPTVASDGGAGTLGSPWTRADGQVEQYAVDQIVAGTKGTDGDVVNIKSGTRHTNLSAAISVSGYSPTNTVPITFRGYDSAEADGGIADLNGGGSVGVFVSSAQGHTAWINCKIHNVGSNLAIHAGTNTHLVGCEITNGSTHGVNLGTDSSVQDCHIHNFAGSYALSMVTRGYVVNCFVDQDGGSSATGISAPVAMKCIVRGFDTGISGNTQGFSVVSCAVEAPSTPGTNAEGILLTWYSSAVNNIVSGYNGTGNAGVRSNSTTVPIRIANNSFYDCTANVTTDAATRDTSNNQTLTADPFTDGANEDFSPTDEVNGAEPSTFRGTATDGNTVIGAAQKAASGGGITVARGMHGGIRS